jgi:hypothetical protein
MPFEVLLAHGVDDATSALMHPIEVFDERRNSDDFHDLFGKGGTAGPPVASQPSG